jgi:hypothetical protein
MSRAGILGHLWGPLTTPISEMWGRYWLHLSDLTNRKETPLLAGWTPNQKWTPRPHIFSKIPLQNPGSGIESLE